MIQVQSPYYTHGYNVEIAGEFLGGVVTIQNRPVLYMGVTESCVDKTMSRSGMVIASENNDVL